MADLIYFNRVECSTDTLGTASITFSGPTSSDFQTPLDAGAVDGDLVAYVLEEGADWEIGYGTIFDSGTKMSRDSVQESKKLGVKGTDKIELGGTAVIRLLASAQALNSLTASTSYWAKAGEDAQYTADHTFAVGDGSGKWKNFNKATAVVANLPLLSDTINDHFLFRNSGTGDLVITPNATANPSAPDQIENASTFVVPSGYYASVWPNVDKTMWHAMYMGAQSPLSYLRVDAAQSLSLAQQTQGLVNLGLSGARDAYRNRLRNSSMSYGYTFFAGIGGPGTTEIIPGWFLGFNTSAGGIDAGRVANATANGSPYRLKVACSVADTSIAAGEFVRITQPIAGREIADFKFGTANAVKVLAKFQVKLPQGTWCAALSNAAGTRSCVKTFTISALEANTEVTKTVAFDGDTSGTWLTSYASALYFQISLTAGSTYQAASLGVWATGNYFGHSTQSNFLASNTNVFEIGDLQLVADPSGSGVAPAWQSEPDVINTLRVKRYSPAADVQAGGRLTLTFGNVPVTSADVTGASGVYYTPYINNQIGVYVGNGWVNFTFDETLMGGSTPTASRPFDVWGYLDSNGLFAMDFTSWSSTTARATALALQDGILVKSGDIYRRYLGTCYADASQQYNDSYALRHVWNMYNRVERPMRAIDTTDSWTYTLTTIRQARASSANQISYVVGLVEDNLWAYVQGAFSNSVGTSAGVGLGIDTTTAMNTSALKAYHTGAASSVAESHAFIDYISSIGYHYIAWLEWSTAVGTTTWYGDAGATLMQNGIIGSMRG